MRLDIRKILMPLDENLSLKPSVSVADRISRAIEVMLMNDLRRVAVTNGGRVIGMITLEDALKKVGLEQALKPKGRRRVVIERRRIMVE
ncbi:MAG: CBS domain-containing protein [Deltaproteobacteria bacterium]|nr:CBS domain-containing protein [Deltaproteobacteria bacterium]MBW2075122.1 CBS domain-containing protein [Deltaproteobacteria bacterium]